MKCEYCDSRFEEMPENNVCPNCGATILTMEERRAKMILPDPPVGVYKSLYGRMEIDQKSVTFFLKFMVIKYEITIFFDEIVSVSFKKGKGLECGFLCLRDYKTRHYPLVQHRLDNPLDTSCALFAECYNEDYERAYLFFKKCAQIVREACGDPFEDDNGAPLGRYTGAYGYMEIARDAVTIYKYAVKPTVRIIPYHEIVDVAYRKAGKKNMGGLSICTKNNPKSMEKALSGASVDDTSIDFGVFENDIMFEVYCFIKEQMNQE